MLVGAQIAWLLISDRTESQNCSCTIVISLNWFSFMRYLSCLELRICSAKSEHFLHVVDLFFMPRHLMGTKVDRVSEIHCKFQKGQSQDQEQRRLKKLCKDWCNLFGLSMPIYCTRLHRSRWDHKKKKNQSYFM